MRVWIPILSVLLAISLPARAQTFTTLHSFTNSDGQFPIAGLVLASNVLYGTASRGGAESNGTVFAVNIDGSNFRVLHSFSTTDPVTGTNWDGAFPYAGLVLCSNKLYGIASEGGTNTQGSFGDGTVFSINTDGSCFKILHEFDGSDGYFPHARLLLLNGTLYGTTYSGGDLEGSYGTIFSLNTDGSNFTSIHSFYGVPEGANPEGTLLSISNILYGTTVNGGGGTIFSTASTTAYTDVLHKFGSPQYLFDGGTPLCGLLYSGGELFGTTSAGGTNNNGIIFSLNPDGSDYAALHDFSSTTSNTNTDGALPDCELISSGNTLYGTTYLGGCQGNGVVFAMSSDGGNYTVLHNFSGVDPVTYANTDGAYSESSLVLFQNTLYGTATSGGSQGNGTVFSLQLPSVLGVTCNADGSVTLRFAGGANINWVQAATNLASPCWQTISTNAAGTNGLWQFTDTNAINYPLRFYRSAAP